MDLTGLLTKCPMCDREIPPVVIQPLRLPPWNELPENVREALGRDLYDRLQYRATRP